jgi:hypothetical protein
MFGKIALSVTIAILIANCARPKYVSDERPASDSSQNKTVPEGKADCSLRLSVSGHCLTWSWENQPTAQKPGSLVFKIFRLNQFDQSSVELDTSVLPEVILWMPSMGHGSSPTKVTRLDTGTYRADDVFFVMPGAWQIKFQVREENRSVDGVIVDVGI